MRTTENVVYSFFHPETGNLLDKHYRFFVNAMNAVRGLTDVNVLHFGGGIRGGKTFCCLATMRIIANEFPGTHFHIVRDTLPSLTQTTLKSFLKLCGPYKKLSQGGSKGTYVELHNGSVFHFFAEQYDRDKDLDRFKGLETNIFFLEQIEELNPLTFQKAQERMGSWRFDGEPNPIILTTFNPTHVQWIRDMVYKPYITGKIPSNHFIQFVTASDNPFVSDAQWKGWSGMDKMHYQQYVKGDWDVFENLKSFAYNFDKSKHVGQVLYRKGEDIYISFDFNVNPSVCLLAHRNDEYLHIFKEFYINNSNIYELCENIAPYTESSRVYVTGDSSGLNRNIHLKDNANTYELILRLLNITKHCLHISHNLGIRDSRIICNTALATLDILIDSGCEHLIDDLMTVEATATGDIERKIAIKKSQDPSKTHLLDCFRYYIHNYYLKQLKQPYQYIE